DHGMRRRDLDSVAHLSHRRRCMTIEPFAPAHLRGLSLLAAQAYLQPYLAAGYAEFLAAGSEAPRSVLIDGQVVACMGIAEELGIGRLVWCFLSADVGRHMVRVYRCLREFAREHASPNLYATTEE